MNENEKERYIDQALRGLTDSEVFAIYLSSGEDILRFHRLKRVIDLVELNEFAVELKSGKKLLVRVTEFCE